MKRVTIGSRTAGPDLPVLVIAELGINHNGDPGLARELVDAAFEAGADGVKFQTYRTETRFSPGNPFVDVFRRCELSESEEHALWSWTRARWPGKLVLSSPFDAKSVRFLADLGADALKIASFEAVNLELVRAAAATRRTILFSTGTLSESEVLRAAAIIEEHGGEPFPLHCVSSYPTREEDANLRVITQLATLFQGLVGYSDHTLGVGASPFAVALGASLIEKHFTLDRALPGPDHAMSIIPAELRALVNEVARVMAMRGSYVLGPRACEAFIYENCRRVTA